MMPALSERGYAPLYRPGDHCPACGASAWHVGRRSAQCARCDTALPLAHRPFGGERHG